MNELLGGRYQIIKKIGSGGMAIVYLAKDLSLDRNVAIKVLRDEYTEDSTFRRHFQKEAVAIAQLSHNNIVGIYDILTEDENMCLVMEYVEGETLKDKINRDGAIPWQLVVKYGIQIANALSYAHANQIIHKDVKSQNILIDKDDNVKITDFGISQMMNNTTITHNKGVLGSAHYFSPEQARGEKLSYQTDIYSLGIVLYEMLVGELPFTADNPVSVALKHIQEPVKPVHAIINDVPESLSFIISKCLEKKPENRFATMQALSRALSGVKAGSPGRVAAVKDKTMTKAVPITTAAMAAGAAKKTAARENAEKTPKETVAKKEAGAATVAAAAKAAKNAKNKKPSKSNKQKKKTNFFVLAVIVLLVLGATIFLAQKIAPPSELTVPDFRGMTFEAAEKVADKRGLYLNEVGSEYSENYNEGEIVSQTPSEGTNVSKGDTISVVISKGSQQATVPDVRGMTLEEATKKLEECDLKVGNVMESYSDTVRAGEIISQGYEPDVKIDRESAVNLEISLGESPYTIVPNCVGSDINSAKAMLEEAKLKVGNITYKKSESENNLVVEQSVDYGSKVDEYTTVDLVVSSGESYDDDDDDGNADGNAEVKSQRISFTAPSTGTMEIVLTDSQGTRVVDLKSVSEGDSIAGVYDYYGRGEFVIKIDGTVIQTIPVS